MKRLLFIALVVLASGCRLQPDASEVLNHMVVVTNYDQTVDFDDFPTYAMITDSIAIVTNSNSIDWLKNDFARLITNTIRHNLTTTGRVKVDTTQGPSLAVNVYVVNDIQTYQNVVYPNYYGGGYGGYYGYPGYYNYPQVVTSQSQSAILVIEFVDLLNIDPDTGEVRVIWAANIGDLINSFDPNDKVVEAIDQAFTQSDYLKL